MANKIYKGLLATSLAVTCLVTSLNLEVQATGLIDDKDIEVIKEENVEDFIAMDEDGNITYIAYEDVERPDEALLLSTAVVIGDSPIQTDSTIDVEHSVLRMNEPSVITETEGTTTSNEVSHGVVVFNDMNSGSTTTSYNDAVTGAPGYTNGAYGPDAAYLGMVDDKVKFMISGVTGLCSASAVTIHEYDDFVESGKITSSYTVKNGRIYHNITTNLTNVASTQLFGYQQSYMNDNDTYFSYDGHYFYKDYKTMVTDYKNGNFKNAINPNQPYYNYYMYLSHRTTADFTAEEMNAYIASKTTKETSKMLNTGSLFIAAQNSYGSNAALMYGLAINESAYGNSSIAQNTNNLFGHGAVDSNPYYGATGYTSVEAGINYHAEYFVSRQYTDAKTDYRYYGAHLGNKQSGFNVKYASDPYWGEKAAANCYYLEDANTSSISDYGRYEIGIVNGKTPVYNSPDGSVLYNANNMTYATYNVPVVILDSVTYNDVKWYRIQSDMPIQSDRESVLFSEKYSMEEDYAYIKASLVTVVNTGEEIIPTYTKGDPSGDDKITSLDYILVKNHIMGTSILYGNALLAADTSGDGKITSLDYIQIKNHIMGTTLIQ